MTARRKAALKKAQLASARKRRRRRAAAGVVAGTLALGAGAYAVHVGKERRWRKVNGIDYSIRRVVLTDRYRTRKKLKRLQTKIDKSRIGNVAYRAERNAWYVYKIVGNQMKRIRRRNG